MGVPGFQDIMLPLLKFLGDRQEHTKQEAEQVIAEAMGLTDTDLRKLLPSGKQGVFSNRLGWARTYMAKAGPIDSPSRGVMQITEHYAS